MTNPPSYEFLVAFQRDVADDAQKKTDDIHRAAFLVAFQRDVADDTGDYKEAMRTLRF